MTFNEQILICGILLSFVGVMWGVKTQKDKFKSELDQKNREIRQLQEENERQRVLELRSKLYFPTVGAFSELNGLLVMIPLVAPEQLVELKPSKESTHALNHKDIIASTELFSALHEAMLQFTLSVQLLRLGRKEVDNLGRQIDELGQHSYDIEMMNKITRIAKQRDSKFIKLVEQSMIELRKLNEKYFVAVALMRKEIGMPELDALAVKKQLDSIVVNSQKIAD